MEVGRASKTAIKGLVAARDNAWFESPIMSRVHAIIQRAPEKSLIVVDCGSTHGTYIGEMRLEKEKRHSLGSGEVITFGTKVTSGTSTYLPQHFRIAYSWKDSSEVAVDERNRDRSVGFHLPSEHSDSDDDDQSREDSLEPSRPSSSLNTPSTSPLSAPHVEKAEMKDLEIVHPWYHRMTEKTAGERIIGFSRPKASPEVICIHESEYTRAAAKNKQVDVYDVNWGSLHRSEKADLGSSQAHPIDLEKADQQKQTEYAVVSDSEDDTPEALPISQFPSKPSQVQLDAGPSKATPLLFIEPIEDSDVSDGEASIDLDAPQVGESTIADSEMILSDSEELDLADEEQTNYDSESDSDMRDEDDDRDSETSSRRYENWDTDVNEDDENDANEEVWTSGIKPLPGPRALELDANTHVEVPVRTSMPGESSRMVEDSQMKPTMATATACFHERLEPSGLHRLRKPTIQTTRRAPSPSDAALAKPQNVPAPAPVPAPVPAPAALSRILCEENAKDKMVNSLSTVRATISGSHYAESVLFTNPNANFGSYAMNMETDFPLATKSSPAGGIYFGHQSPNVYDDGPFAWAHRPFASPDRVEYNHPSDQYPVSPPSHTNANYSELQNPWISTRAYEQPMHTEPSPYPFDQHLDYAESSRLNKKEPVKSSKVLISNIVNDATTPTDFDSKVSSLKRKIDRISSDEYSFPSPIKPIVLPFDDSQETVHHDAQAREDVLPVERESPPTERSTIRTPSPVPVGEPVTPAKTCPGPAPASVPDQDQEVQEPARKRVKRTSTLKRIPSVKSFVSGMIAGGISVVGALLVYGATAPEALQEVVRRELEAGF
ncbi:MAG: hypothetical protein MMC33_008154 [Icmadophila ericetorum]|nr:hypothetical protein [Icmadophila ericetorum]